MTYGNEAKPLLTNIMLKFERARDADDQMGVWRIDETESEDQ